MLERNAILWQTSNIRVSFKVFKIEVHIYLHRVCNLKDKLQWIQIYTPKQLDKVGTQRINSVMLCNSSHEPISPSVAHLVTLRMRKIMFLESYIYMKVVFKYKNQ